MAQNLQLKLSLWLMRYNRNWTWPVTLSWHRQTNCNANPCYWIVKEGSHNYKFKTLIWLGRELNLDLPHIKGTFYQQNYASCYCMIWSTGTLKEIVSLQCQSSRLYLCYFFTKYSMFDQLFFAGVKRAVKVPMQVKESALVGNLGVKPPEAQGLWGKSKLKMQSPDTL